MALQCFNLTVSASFCRRRYCCHNCRQSGRPHCSRLHDNSVIAEPIASSQSQRVGW
ncbi:hypothetical protein BDR03DRAFT_953815 [Suillus americanus]|nr:hypothetical protein BDR03DRAFT_953815 [Suillus americanus]